MLNFSRKQWLSLHPSLAILIISKKYSHPSVKWNAFQSLLDKKSEVYYPKTDSEKAFLSFKIILDQSKTLLSFFFKQKQPISSKGWVYWAFSVCPEILRTHKKANDLKFCKTFCTRRKKEATQIFFQRPRGPFLLFFRKKHSLFAHKLRQIFLGRVWKKGVGGCFVIWIYIRFYLQGKK